MARKGSYRHAGCDVHSVRQTDGRFKIVVKHNAYIETLTDVDIPPERLRSNCSLNKHEIACRATLYKWASMGGSPDTAASCRQM